MTKAILFVSMAVFCVASGIAVAEDAPPKVVQTPNDQNNYRGDGLNWSTAIEASKVPGGPPVYCIPADTTLVGLKSSLDDAQIKAEKSTTGVDSVNTQWLRVRLSSGTNISSKDFAEDCPDLVANGKPGPVLHQHQAVYVSSGYLADVDRRWGWEFGALVVPFKLQLGHGKSLTSTATIGPYLGYRIPIPGTAVVFSPIAFAGASSIPVSKASGSSITTENIAGLSSGGGIIFSIKDSFQVGMVAGVDHVDTTAQYKYNNKWWVSFEIGYSFAR